MAGGARRIRYPADEGLYGSYRWSGGNSKMTLPGFGTQAALVEFHWLLIDERIVSIAPATYQGWQNEHLLAEIPDRRSGSRQWLLIPVAADGNLRLRIVSDTFQPPQDPRWLGLPPAHITIATGSQGWVWPAVDRLAWWVGAVVLG